MTDAVSVLTGMGFQAEVLGEKQEVGQSKTVVRIRTSKGWAYEKFSASPEAEIARWAKGREPYRGAS